MEPEVDEVWAYRARGVDPLSSVRVVKHGQRKPARVLIRFEDEDLEAHEEWVPPARLKVHWDNVDDFIAEEARWKAVYDLSPDHEDVEGRTAGDLLETLVPWSVADISSQPGVLHIKDTQALAELSGLPVEELTGHEVSFVGDGAVVAPWPVMRTVAKARCRRMPERVLAEVDQEERKVQDELVHGFSWGRDSPHRDREIERSIVRDVDEKHGQPSRDPRRQWCGLEATARWDELTELRKEIHRVGEVAERAIEVLRKRGHAADADRLGMELGQTVEMLRVDPD